MNRRDALGNMAGVLSGTFAARVVPPELFMDPRHSETQTKLLTRTIPSTNEQMPVIGLGTWQTFDVGSAAEQRAPLQQVIAKFVARGGRMVDSSPMYGASEEVVGEITGAQAARPKLFMATKVWTSGKAAGITQMEASMSKLRAKPIDLMQVHNLMDVETHLKTLRDWKRDSIVRYIGVTHYTEGSLGDVERHVRNSHVDFVQINYSVGERGAETRLLAAARDMGVAVIANRPFAGGGLIRSLMQRPLPAWAHEINCSSWAQLLLKFVVSHPAITCAIPGTSSPTHLDDNLNAAIGAMPDAEMRARIASAAMQ